MTDALELCPSSLACYNPLLGVSFLFLVPWFFVSSLQERKPNNLLVKQVAKIKDRINSKNNNNNNILPKFKHIVANTFFVVCQGDKQLPKVDVDDILRFFNLSFNL